MVNIIQSAAPLANEWFCSPHVVCYRYLWLWEVSYYVVSLMKDASCSWLQVFESFSTVSLKQPPKCRMRRDKTWIFTSQGNGIVSCVLSFLFFFFLSRRVSLTSLASANLWSPVRSYPILTSKDYSLRVHGSIGW